MLVEFEKEIPIEIETFLMQNYSEQILAMSPKSILFKPKAELDHAELEAISKRAGMALKISVPAVGASVAFGEGYIYTYTPLGWVLNIPIPTAEIKAEFARLSTDFTIETPEDKQLLALCEQHFVAGSLWTQAKR